MNQYLKPIDYNKAMVNKCQWCISRQFSKFDCEFEQGRYFSVPCSKEDYATCPDYTRGERLIKDRGY